MKRPIGPTLFLLALGLVADARAASPEDAKRAAFRGVVEVDAQGGVRVEQLDGVGGALADAVRSQLQAHRALPAQRGGQPVPARAPVSGSVVLTPEGQSYAVGLDAIAFAPAALRRVPIVYPIEAMREERAGWIEVDFGLAADGAPTDLRVVRSSHRAFVKAVEKSLPSWRFSTAAVEPGRRFRLGVTFRTDTAQPTPAFECAADAAHPRFDDRPACADIIHVHGSRVARHHF